MSDKIQSTQQIFKSSAIAKAQKAAQANAKLRSMTQVSTQRNLKEWAQDASFVLGKMTNEFKTLDELNKFRKKEAAHHKEEVDEEELIADIDDAQTSTEEFFHDNPEMDLRALSALKKYLSNADTPEQILKKVLEFYPDPTLADEALDYLLQNTSKSLAQKVKKAKDILQDTKGREILAGKNINIQAQEFSKELGSPTALRDLYREVTCNPQESYELFNKIFNEFPFEKIKIAIDFMLHSLGADLRAKGSSISKAELQKLIKEARALLSILGVYRFFQSRMNLINSQFSYYELSLPSLLTFENLARQYMKLINERYISSERILQLSLPLGIAEEAVAQMIIFTQMRDATRQTAPRLYKSDQKRIDILMAFIDTLEELEEELEEDSDEDEEEDSE